MKHTEIKKVVAAAITALCTMSAAPALDFGGSVSASMDVGGHKVPYLDQTKKYGVTAWAKAPLNEDNSMNLNLQLSYLFKDLYKYSQGADGKLSEGDRTFGHLPDLDLLKFNYREDQSNGDSLQFSAGRFQYFDSTSIIFAQTCDGALAQYTTSSTKVGMYLGYTGFLNQRKVFILDKNGKNYQESSADEEEDEKLYSCADPYFISSLSVSFPYLLFNQTLGLEVSSFIGVDSPFRDNPDYNRFYATVSLNGPLEPKLYYAASTTFETEEFIGTGNLSQISFTYFPEFWNSSVSLYALYASGNDNGPFARFRGFTSNSVTYSRYAPELSGLIKAGFTASMKPLRTVYTSGGIDFVFGCPTEDFYYHGWQWHAEVKVQCTNDLQIAISEYRYMGYESDDPNNSGASIKIIFSF